jgi:hypothetical protein
MAELALLHAMCSHWVVLVAATCAACGRGDTEFEREWRAQARERFGAEPAGVDDGPHSYVEYAHFICDMTKSDRIKFLYSPNGPRASNNYRGSLEEFIIDTFCPHVWGEGSQ